MPPTLSPQAFVAKWRSATLKERSAAQEHFIDLCRLVGHPTPAESDPTGTQFTFEAGADKQRGGTGWADVWKRGFFAMEYKGKHADLDKAYEQLLQYRESLENPPLLIVSDIDTIVIHTNFTNTVKQVHRLTLDDLLTPVGMQRLRDVFYQPEAFRVARTTEQVTLDAAREFAKLAALLRKYGEEPPHIAHFLIRLLFCLFAEDVGLLPNKVFSRLLQSTRQRSSIFAAQLQQLFDAMATGGYFAIEDIPYFNGRLFDDNTVLELDSDGLDILARVVQLDWSSIEPSIFGTLFERSLDPSNRAQLGAHYTSRDDILLIVEPVLMAPLRRRWADVQQQARDAATQRDAATPPAQRTRLHNQLSVLLQQFAGEIADVKVLDPACGSGNFLYVALKALLDLEKEVITLAADLDVGRFVPSVGPEQLRGIEVNEYAHELAQVTVWIGYIQWLRDNGFGVPSAPILKPLDTIVQMDAVLAFDGTGQAVEPVWPDADVVIGNPPFLGGNRVRQELGGQYVDALFRVYERRVPAFADFVCYWFERARSLIDAGKLQRAGLLATNSIRGGVNRKVLEHIKQTGDVFMAWSDRPWVLEGAAVRVSMIGFDNGTAQDRSLNGVPATAINADLTGDINLTYAQRLVENVGICFIGTKKAGAFDVDATFARSLLAAPLNPNGRPNSDVVFPWLNGEMIVKRAQRRWIISFGEMPLEEAALYEKPFAYVQKHVYPERQNNNEARARVKWWQHRRPATEMRAAVAKLRRYIVTPRVSKYRLFAWVSSETVPDDGIYIFAREDDYFFAVLHSKLHELWALRMGTALEDRPRYTPTTTFETFPFPWPPGHEPQGDPRVEAVAAAARALVEKRDRWLNPEGASEADLKKRTLTNLYNERPMWLDLAHQQLDRAVLDAYGWPHDLSDDEILQRLLDLNSARAGVAADV